MSTNYFIWKDIEANEKNMKKKDIITFTQFFSIYILKIAVLVGKEEFRFLFKNFILIPIIMINENHINEPAKSQTEKNDEEIKANDD